MSGTALIVFFGFAGVFSVVLFLLFGRDKKATTIEATNPPEGITPLDTRVILGGRISAADMAPLIISWANRGYISINGIGKMGEDDFELVRLKNADDGMKPYEKQLFDEIFNGRSSIETADVRGKFFTGLGGLKLRFAMQKSPSVSARFFTKASIASSVICGLMAGLCTGIMSGMAAYTCSSDIATGVASGVIIFVVTVLFCALLKYFTAEAGSGKKSGVVLDFIIYAAALFYMAGVVYTSCDFKAAAIVSALSAALCGISAAFSKKHTEPELYAKLLGLKRFIAGTEAGAKRASADPSLFYGILPFACAFGEADKWVSRFKGISVANPDWYKSDTHSMFDTVRFIKLTGGTISVSSDMASSPVSGFMGGQGFRSGNDGNRGGR